MREFFNNVSITGVLVKNTLEEKTSVKGDYIGGELILRTADGGEHEVKLFSYKYKKDDKGNFTNDESKLYISYKTMIDEYKSLEKYSDEADVISIKNGTFGINDYKNQKGEVSTYNQLSTKFANRVEKKDLETTMQNAKFEVEGVIQSIADEMIRDECTGSIIINLNVINQSSEGKGKDKICTPISLFPVKLTVTSEMSELFKSAGYYEGSFVKFVGKLINNTERVEIVEKQAFGADNVKVFDKIIQRYEIVSGGNPQTIYDVELTDDIYNQLQAKRSAKLAEVKAGKAAVADATTSSPAPTTGTNPFANPFAK